MAEHHDERNLKPSIDLMHKELERLKDEISDSLLSLDEHNMGSDVHGLHRELLQLHLVCELLKHFPLPCVVNSQTFNWLTTSKNWWPKQANERLGTIFPLFKEFSGSENALERVLALEIELSEALQSNKKSIIHFQSSFLKLYNDDQAVFQSLRDINELIKDMLELKRRNGAVE
ncbi:uncharacterized protein [Aristolochia californica]|uniref:uncharacterized protein isoform X1 n=1 Tax=Aristolochia californica TaxID=171875 RepID=UPI0035DDF4A0